MGIMRRQQKLGIILENQSSDSKFQLSKITVKIVIVLLSFVICSILKINLRKIQMDLDLENCVQKSILGTFLGPGIISICKIQLFPWSMLNSG